MMALIDGGLNAGVCVKTNCLSFKIAERKKLVSPIELLNFSRSEKKSVQCHR